MARAEAADPDCRATLDRYEDRLARSLARVINLVAWQSLSSVPGSRDR